MSLWKTIIVAWITIEGGAPAMLPLQGTQTFLSESDCRAYIAADAGLIEGMLENIAAGYDGELLSHVAMCTESDDGQPT